MSRSDDIVAYTYKADTYCPTCIVEELRRRITGYGPFDWTLDAETVLDQVALANGIDRYEETTFDSDEFPKVVFRDALVAAIDDDSHYNNCGGCHEEVVV